MCLGWGGFAGSRIAAAVRAAWSRRKPSQPGEDHHRYLPARGDIGDSGRHGGAGPEGERTAIRQMQEGMRAALLRAAQGSGRGLRAHTPWALQSLLCAGAFWPMIKAAGISIDPVVVQGFGVLSSIGANVLSGVVAGALERRPAGKRRAASAADLEGRSPGGSSGRWRPGMRTRGLCGLRSLRCWRRSTRAGPCCGRRLRTATNGAQRCNRCDRHARRWL
jgi:hypothetical protein